MRDLGRAMQAVTDAWALGAAMPALDEFTHLRVRCFCRQLPLPLPRLPRPPMFRTTNMFCSCCPMNRTCDVLLITQHIG